MTSPKVSELMMLRRDCFGVCLQAIDVYNGDSDDVEVFDANLNNGIATATARAGSSSSSRKSSYNDALHDRPMVASGDASLHPLSPSTQMLPRVTSKPHNSSTALSLAHPMVVEWRPEENQLDENSLPTTPQDKEDGSLRVTKKEVAEEETVGEEEIASPNEQDEFMNDVYSSTVTVTIDVPRDENQGDEDDPMTRYLGGSVTPRGKFHSGGGRESEKGVREAYGGGVGCDGGVGGLWSIFGEEATGGEQRQEEEDDLYECLNEVDMAEDEDSDTPPPVRLCLLSRYRQTQDKTLSLLLVGGGGGGKILSIILVGISLLTPPLRLIVRTCVSSPNQARAVHPQQCRHSG